MTGLAVWVDDYALRSLPGVELDLSRVPALVMRCFERLPNPSTVGQLGQYRQVAVVGGGDLGEVVRRVELAATSLRIGIIGALPPGVVAPRSLRGPGLLDLLPAHTPGAAHRIALMAAVPIVSGRAQKADEPPAPPRRAEPPPTAPLEVALPSREGSAFAIASSTGGCWVLAELLRALDGKRLGPVLVAQHMDPEFVGFFARWLEATSGRRIVIVSGLTALSDDTVYLAQGGCDLCVTDAGHVVSVPPSGRFIPSANRLFRTFAEAFGARGTAVVLSGMGEDGAEGTVAVVRHGGTAFCQHPSTAIIPSMPSSAQRASPSVLALTPDALAAALGATRRA
ncbi:MAG: CheB methylesterase domain-containing protein [Archangium sp.]|nr:CheB methylesterase domain-containing protein [Archangium sp.]